MNGAMSVEHWRRQTDIYFGLYPELAPKVSMLDLLAPEFAARALARIGVADAAFDPAPGVG